MLLNLDANAALLLAALGSLLICAEFCLPGWVLPGVAGGVCLLSGVYRLTLIETNLLAAAGLAIAAVGVGAAGYGILPAWSALPLLLAIPWICRLLAPGSIVWPAAVLAAAPPLVAFQLLRVASRAAANKTLLQ